MSRIFPNHFKSIAKKYSIPYSYDINSHASLSFLSSLDILYKKHKNIFVNLSNKQNLVVLDVGCGYFRYGKVLHVFFSKLNPNLRILSVDKIRKMPKNYYFPSEFIKGDVCNFSKILNNKNVSKIDLFTVCNPFHEIPDLNS